MTFLHLPINQAAQSSRGKSNKYMKTILVCSAFMTTRTIDFISKHSLTSGFINRVDLNLHFPARTFFCPSSLRWRSSDAHTWDPENLPSTLPPTCNYSYLLKATEHHLSWKQQHVLILVKNCFSRDYYSGRQLELTFKYLNLQFMRNLLSNLFNSLII